MSVEAIAAEWELIKDKPRILARLDPKALSEARIIVRFYRNLPESQENLDLTRIDRGL